MAVLRNAVTRIRDRVFPTTPTTPTPTPTGTNTLGPEPKVSTKKLEYADDKSMRMPVLNSPAQLAAARRTARQLSARSGRTSTALVSDAGVRPYTASLLGNAN